MPEPVTIILKPTKRIEQLGPFKFRVYEGHTDTGIRLRMLGLFQIADADRKAEFERAVCSVDVGDPAPVKLLRGDDLLSP